jgi:hypothetical protein
MFSLSFLSESDLDLLSGFFGVVPGFSFNDFTVESFILFAKSGPTNH